MRAHRLACSVLLLASCGDDASTAAVDAASGSSDDAGADAPVPIPCDYTEAADATNNTTTTAEATSLTLGARLTLCGSIDTGHFASQLVDADAFKFTVASDDTDVIMHITGSSLTTPADVVIQLRAGNAYVAFGVVVGDHGTLIARLAAGEYSATMAAFNASDLAAPIDYRLTIRPDAPDTRCPQATTGPSYDESMDGASHDGNDVISYSFTANNPSSLTASTTDAPEPTGHTVAPATSYRVRGSSAAVDPADDYEDRDTFAFTTGPSTTQMTIRLNWPATTVDLDYRVYPVTSAGAPLSIVGGLDELSREHELETFAVEPDTTYWLWIGAADGATGQPAAYDATLCGETLSL